jgi:hypothetical protein
MDMMIDRHFLILHYRRAIARNPALLNVAAISSFSCTNRVFRVS